ncbi:hypothetical protein BH23CHL7_BH23CHL7_04590 [soil metagenome]
MTQGSISQGQKADSQRDPDHHQPESGQKVARKYARFLAMIATSTVMMYLLTYTNVFDVAHIRFSEERLYMALLMGSMMAIVMLGFMWGMHPNKRANVAIIVGALGVGAVSFYLSQSQILVDDRSYMQGMIPHHSIAILTSERAGIEDLRVRELADGIIAAQVREIGEMDWLIRDIGANGRATTEAEAEARPVPSFGPAP